VAVTAELPKAITIDKNFGHFAHVEDFLIINSACDDERFDKQYDQLCSFVTKNLACVPMTTDQKTVGILECCNKKTDFIGEDLFLLGHVAQQLAVAQMGIEIREKLMNLHQSGKNPLIESSKESLIVPVLSTLASNLMEILSCEKVNVFLHLPASQELANVASTGKVDHVRLPMNEGLPWLAFSTNSVVNSDSSHKLFSQNSDKRTGFASREVLIVPIKNLGVIECLNKKNFSKFSKSDEKKITVLCDTFKSIFEAANRLSGVLYTADVNEFCIQNVKQAVFHLNVQAVVQKLNPVACEFLGIKAEQVIGASLTEAFSKFPQIIQSFWACVKSKSSKHEESLSLGKCDVILKFFLLTTLEESPSYLMIMTLI
jgi:putative methionine-R-sulfoxide reductase with GAF domain